MRGLVLGSIVHRHNKEVDRHSVMVLMLRPVAVVGAVGGLVAGSSLSLVCQAALKPLAREAILVRSVCFPPVVGVPGGGGEGGRGVELAPSLE